MRAADRVNATFLALGLERFDDGFLIFAFFFFGAAAGFTLRAALAFDADDVDSALRRDVLDAGALGGVGRFEVLVESPARLFGPSSRAVRAPGREAASTSSGRPSSARLYPVMLLPGALG